LVAAYCANAQAVLAHGQRISNSIQG
jgi:hypothetical protein